MEKERYISDYIINYDLDIEKMIKDFRGYVIQIVNNSSNYNLSVEDKEEIVSDVFLSVWHNKKRIDNARPLKNYIVGITKNLIKNKLRDNKKDSSNENIEDNEIANYDTLEIVYEQEQINNVIAEELNNMKKIDYEIFSRFYYLDKSIKKIAEELNISEGNVKIKLHRIRKKLQSSFKKRGIMPQILTVVLMISFITGAVFAKEIVQFIEKIFANTSEGVNTAIQNGYIQNVDMNYIENAEVEMKVDNILMDDYNLNINFNINLQEEFSGDNIDRVMLGNLMITDENNNLIVFNFESSSRYEEYCRENNIEITYNNLAYSAGRGNFKLIEINDSNIICSYSNQSYEYPKSQELNISFDKIILSGTKLDEDKVIEGKWNIKIELDEEIRNRETIIYDLEYCNDSNLELIYAKVSKTGMLIKFKTIWGEPVYLDTDSEDEKNRKKQEFYDKPHSIRELLIKNNTVINEEGKMFYPPHNQEGNVEYGQLLDGTLIYVGHFNLTSYDASDTITVVLEKGGEWKKYDGEEIILKLLRKIPEK